MADGAGAPQQTTEQPPKKRPKTVTVVVLGIAALLVIGGIVTWAILAMSGSGSDAAPEPSTTPTSTEEAPVPSATPSASAEAPEDGPMALPTDCREIYTQEFLDTYGQQPLNDPTLDSSTISSLPAVEAIRTAQPGIDCKWGLPTEGGLFHAVNSVTPEAEAEAIAAIEANAGTCGQADEGTLCSYTLDLNDGWLVEEEYLFRDGLWVTTWFAHTQASIDAATEPVYSTLWP